MPATVAPWVVIDLDNTLVTLSINWTAWGNAAPAERDTLELEAATRAVARPGAVAFLYEARAQGAQVVIYTNNNVEAARRALAVAKLPTPDALLGRTPEAPLERKTGQLRLEELHHLTWEGGVACVVGDTHHDREVAGILDVPFIPATPDLGKAIVSLRELVKGGGL